MQDKMIFRDLVRDDVGLGPCSKMDQKPAAQGTMESSYLVTIN